MCDVILCVLPDRVLFAKSSDREASEPQRVEWHAARDHAPGDVVACTWMTIPQVERTHAIAISRPIWMWGAEIGANEHGVVIGNEAVFTKEPVPAEGGLTGMDLLRLALERSRSAEEAVHVIASLCDRHGQGGSCGFRDKSFRYFSSFGIADARGAWVLETAGRVWATERVEGARTISNCLTIRGFADAHGALLKTAISASRIRRARSTELAANASNAADLVRALRDHRGAPWPRYAVVNGAMSSVCMHGGGLIASSQTTASWVSELRDRGARHFATGTSAPCLSVFKPLSADEPLDIGPAPEETPNASLWWSHERFHRVVMRDPAALAPLFLAERDALEERFLAGTMPEQGAWSLAKEALDRWTDVVLRHASRDVRPWHARRYWARQTRFA